MSAKRGGRGLGNAERHLLLLQKGDLAGAEPLARRALEIFRRVKGDTHKDTREAAEAVRAVLRGRGGVEEIARLEEAHGI